MAILRSTQVQGKLEVINSDLYVTGSGSLIHGNLDGTAKIAEGLDPTKDIVIGTTEATHSLTVNGNLKVTGDVVYTDTANLRVKDKNIELNVDENGEAASSRAGATGAGITVKAVTADGQNEDVTLTYDDTKKAWTSNVPFDVVISGSVDNAKNAETASKVAHTLKNGTGISTFTFDGSADATVQVDDSHIKGVKVDNAAQADNATTAGTASKTVGKLTVAANDYVTLEGGFDGSENAEIKVNLTDVAKQADVTAVTDKVTALETTVANNKTAAEDALATAKSDLQASIDTKVDKVEGKSLVSDTEITKLAGIEAEANHTDVDAALDEESTNPVQNKVVAEKINALWAKQFPISVTAQVTANPSYEFDGKDHSVTVKWTAINGKASSVTVSDGTTTKNAGLTEPAESGTLTFTKSSQGGTTYTVTATIDGKQYKATASANAWLPQFIGTSTAATVADLDVLSLTKKQSIKTTTTVAAPTAEGTSYPWFCLSGATISKVTSAGFGVNLLAVVTKSVTVGGKAFTYNCYRGVGAQSEAMTYVVS